MINYILTRTTTNTRREVTMKANCVISTGWVLRGRDTNTQR